MKIGFIGIGTIASAMIKGLVRSDFSVEEIVISPRNHDIARILADKYDKVKIAADNQGVIDDCSVVFLCLRSQDAQDILKGLKFRAEQQVVSVISMASAKEVEGWIGHKVFRAVPLPFVEECKGLTPIYPDDKFLNEMFTALGGVIVVKKEEQFNLFVTAGSFMGVYFRFMEATQDWLKQNSMDAKIAGRYLGNMYGNLADEMRKTGSPDFKALEIKYSTPGGTNEIISKGFEDKGGVKALNDAIEDGYKKIMG